VPPARSPDSLPGSNSGNKTREIRQNTLTRTEGNQLGPVAAGRSRRRARRHADLDHRLPQVPQLRHPRRRFIDRSTPIGAATSSTTWPAAVRRLHPGSAAVLTGRQKLRICDRGFYYNAKQQRPSSATTSSARRPRCPQSPPGSFPCAPARRHCASPSARGTFGSTIETTRHYGNLTYKVSEAFRLLAARATRTTASGLFNVRIAATTAADRAWRTLGADYHG
jgi:hypothetical protein